MFTLRLFHQDEPFVQIEARELRKGSLSLGRDASADWPLDDPSRTLSRLHCAFALDQGRLSLQDTSANGVLIGPERRRVAAGVPTPVKPGETVRLGDYLIVVEPIAAPRAKVRTRNPEPANKPVHPDLPLLEAFCAGAGLDASAFNSEDPEQLMRRLGEVYREMVGGLAGLMRERTLAKTDFQLERTTVHGAGNNPFRWAPPDRVSIDLLRTRHDGFLAGGSAVTRSFSDLDAHLACASAGAQAVVADTVAALDPAPLLEAAKQGKSPLKNTAAQAWALFTEAYEKIGEPSLDKPDSFAAKAFRRGYEAEQKRRSS
jgi:predicted component of type VI protein secretion system